MHLRVSESTIGPLDSRHVNFLLTCPHANCQSTSASRQVCNQSLNFEPLDETKTEVRLFELDPTLADPREALCHLSRSKGLPGYKSILLLRQRRSRPSDHDQQRNNEYHQGFGGGSITVASRKADIQLRRSTALQWPLHCFRVSKIPC